MEVGDTGTVQALNAAGQPVTGLAWTSSDPTIVSLSADNPPVLTALAVGRVTNLAGGASADVTVSAGPLPVGTVLWSTAGSVDAIVPAVLPILINISIVTFKFRVPRRNAAPIA